MKESSVNQAELISAFGDTELFITKQGNEQVIVKTLVEESPSAATIARWQYEKELLDKLSSDALLQPLTEQNTASSSVILFQHQKLLSLRNLLQLQPLLWQDKLQLANNLLKAVVGLHKHNIIHRNLNLDTLLVPR